MQVCGWDWQAIAGIAQAAAIVAAAVIARSGIENFLRTRSSTRKAELAEEAAQTASALVQRLRILRAADIARSALAGDIDGYSIAKQFPLFDKNVLTPVEALPPKVERLFELGIAGELYLGSDFELACRRVASSFEYYCQCARSVREQLRLMGGLAELRNEDIKAGMLSKLVELEAQLLVLDGKSTSPPSGDAQFLEMSLTQVRTAAAKFVR